jgi:hypothetical protein
MPHLDELNAHQLEVMSSIAHGLLVLVVKDLFDDSDSRPTSFTDLEKLWCSDTSSTMTLEAVSVLQQRSTFLSGIKDRYVAEA